MEKRQEGDKSGNRENQSGVYCNDPHEKYDSSDHVIADEHVVSPFSVPGHI